MQHFISFLNAKDPSGSQIHEQLKTTLDETLIIQHICRRYAAGTEDCTVIDILQECFENDKYEYVNQLSLVKNLIDLGWIVQSSFGQVKTHESSRLELLSSTVAPSIMLLKLLEDGVIEDTPLPEIKPYTDHLEYLQDQFDMVALLHSMSISKQGFGDSSSSAGRLKSKLSLLIRRIEERISVTTEPMEVEEFFKEKELDEKEQKIFLALLKEEYSAGDGQFREMNSLIELVSFDEYDKIKNRAILEEGSKLISDEIIDYDEILNIFGGISRSFFINEEVLQRIIHPNKKKKVIKLKLDMLVKEQEIFEYLEPTTTLDDVVLHATTRETLDTIMKQIDKDVFTKLKLWGIKDKRKSIDAKIIFYGHAGTGKTMTAMSLAKTLKKPILSFDCSKILSMYVGESEKNVRKIFDDFKALSAKAKVEPILLLNEADQFLSSRIEGTGSGSDKMHNQMQNIFLEQIERFEGILIATTNLLGNIDKAFSRRFDYKLEFKKPAKKQRLQLWQLMLPENADYEDGFEINPLASHELTGAQIKLIIRNTAYKVAVRDESLFTQADFEEEIKKESGSSFDNDGKSMGFRV